MASGLFGFDIGKALSSLTNGIVNFRENLFPQQEEKEETNENLKKTTSVLVVPNIGIVEDSDNDLGWKKLPEGSEEHSVAMQGLITNFQEHFNFNKMSFEEIEERLLKIKPEFVESREIHKVEQNKKLIDEAFELLTTISNDHATNIGVDPNIIEIANMVIEYDKSTIQVHQQSIQNLTTSSVIFDPINEAGAVDIRDHEFQRTHQQKQLRNRVLKMQPTPLSPPDPETYQGLLPVPLQQSLNSEMGHVGGRASKQLTQKKILKALTEVLDKRAHKQISEQNKSPREDEESLKSHGIQISSAPKAIFQTPSASGDAPSMPVFKMPVQMSSLPEIELEGDMNQGLRELSKEHLKELFIKFQESKSSEFKPYYGGVTSKDMFLNVAVEKIQSALRSPASGDRVKRALGSLHLDYDGRNAFNELGGLSATKTLISKTSQNELSDADKNKIKDQLKSSSEFYEKLEEAGVYLLRDKSKNLASAPATSTGFKTRIFRKASASSNQGDDIIFTL